MTDLKKGNTTKIRIIQVATQLIFKEGLYNVTYGQIAKAVGLTSPAIYKHFKNMDDLICEACIHWSNEAKEYIGVRELELQPAESQLKIYIDRNLRFTFENQKKDALLLGLYYHSLHSSKLMRVYQEIKLAAIRRLEVLITRGGFEKTWPAANPREKALSIHAYIVGETVKLIIEPREENIEKRILRVTKQALTILKS